MKRRTAVLIALLALCLCVCAAAEENITANFPFLGTDAYVPYQESYSFTCKVKVPYTALQIRAQLESRDLFEADTTKVFPVTETGSGQCPVHIDPGDYAYPTLIAMNGEFADLVARQRLDTDSAGSTG